MKKSFFAFLFFISHFFIFANDSVISYGSEAVSIDYSEKDICIEKEDLNIYLYKDSYKVTVEYEYFNKGEQKTVQLGFPIKYFSTAGTEEKNKQINEYKFSQIFNGKKIPVKNKYDEVIKDEPYDIEGIFWINREVVFKKGKNFSKIEYTAAYGRGGFFHYFEYIINTAACWNNNIKVLNINIHNDNQVKIGQTGSSWHIGPYSKDNFPENYEYSQNVFKFYFKDVDPGMFDTVSFSVEAYNPKLSFLSWSDGWSWNLYHIYTAKDEVQLYTKDQLQLFINFFYASRGYIFKSPELNDFFKNMYFDLLYCEYTPDENFSEDKFNNIERENLEYLLNLKQKLFK